MAFNTNSGVAIMRRMRVCCFDKYLLCFKQSHTYVWLKLSFRSTCVVVLTSHTTQRNDRLQWALPISFVLSISGRLKAFWQTRNAYLKKIQTDTIALACLERCHCMVSLVSFGMTLSRISCAQYICGHTLLSDWVKKVRWSKKAFYSLF